MPGACLQAGALIAVGVCCFNQNVEEATIVVQVPVHGYGACTRNMTLAPCYLRVARAPVDARLRRGPHTIQASFLQWRVISRCTRTSTVSAVADLVRRYTGASLLWAAQSRTIFSFSPVEGQFEDCSRLRRYAGISLRWSQTRGAIG